MISCNECRNKIVSVLDNESSTEQTKLLFGHLADCQKCRAFYNELIITKQLFSIATTMKEPVTIGRDFMRRIETDALHNSKLSGVKQVGIPRLSRKKFSRILWAGTAAAALLIVASWVTCYALAREVADVKGKLQAANRNLAVVRAERKLEEDRKKEQKAITALYLRMAELESRVEQYSSPRTTFIPAEQYKFSNDESGL
jgi:hypothetical protein